MRVNYSRNYVSSINTIIKNEIKFVIRKIEIKQNELS